MTVYKYLGYGVTNENGVAKLDHNSEGQEISHSYAGTGAGEIDVVASLDNPVSQGSIVSETLPVFDYFLYDSGVTGTKNPNVTVGTNVTEEVTSNGTVLTCTNGTSLATAQYTYTKVIGGDFEAYVTLTTPSSILMGFYGGSDSARISISNVENCTYKFKRTGSNWIVQYYDGSEWVDLSFYNNTLGNKDCRFYLYLYSDNETDTVTFKDVKVSVESVLNIGGDSIVQTGDTINITGKFYDMGVPVKNIDLDIYKNGVKVDTVNTGSTGVASYTYAGTGVGEVDFQFKYGYFVSEIFVVTDSQFYCQGTIGNVNSNWVAETGLTSNPDAEGNLLENSTDSGKYYASNLPNSSASELKDFTAPLCIEFNCISNTGARIFLNSSTGGSNLDRNITSYITGNNKVKMIVRENDYDLIVDGDYKATNVSHTLVNPVSVKIVVNSNCSLKYKDFKVYPI